jgi:transposase
MKATETLLSIKERIKNGKKASCPQSKRCPLRLDARSYSIWFDKLIVSILTIDGRKKFSFKIPTYYQQFISWKQASADLVIKNNEVYLHLVVVKDIEETKLTGKVIGLDAGIKRIVVTSEGQFFCRRKA